MQGGDDVFEGELVPQKRGEGSYGCYYYPRIPCAELTTEEMRRMDETEVLGSKVQLRSRMLEIEIRNAKRLIARVPQHHLYFVLPKRICSLNETRHVADCVNLEIDKAPPQPRQKRKDRRRRRGGGQGDGEELELSEYDYDRSSRWVNMLMTNIQNNISLHAYLRSLPHTERWSSLLHLYKHLTQAVIYMKSVDLVHWDMHLDNILVNARTGTPYIIDFGLSVDVTDAASRRDLGRFGVKPRFYRWTFETQFLMWGFTRLKGRVEGEEAPRSPSVEELVDILVDHTRFFDICSVEFRRSYVRGAKAFYAGLSEEHARSDMMWLGWSTWDTYSNAVLFLQFICSMYSSGFHVNNRMLRDLLRLLLESIHYDWRRRPSAEATLERIDAILDRSYDRDEMELSREYPTLETNGCPEANE